jgi:hypothetical protein
VIDHRPFVLESLPCLRHHADRAGPTPDARHCGLAHDRLAHRGRAAHTSVRDRAEWLAHFLPLPVGYVGVLGSRQRAAQLIESLRDGGLAITPRMERLLHAPLGLDLGGESPESIALAAIAEIEAVMHGRPGGALRERQSPIHTRSPTPHVAP